MYQVERINGGRSSREAFPYSSLEMSPIRPVAQVDLPQKPILTASASLSPNRKLACGRHEVELELKASALRPRIRWVYDKIAYDRTRTLKWKSRRYEWFISVAYGVGD